MLLGHLNYSPSTLKTWELTHNFFSFLAIQDFWLNIQKKKTLKVNHSDNYISYQISSNNCPWSNFKSYHKI